MMLKVMMTVCRYAAMAVSILTASILVIMTAIAGWQVWARYVLQQPATWSEQLCLLLIVYYVLLAAAFCVREGNHLALTFFTDVFPKGWRLFLRGVGYLFMALFGGVMCYGGAELTVKTWSYALPALPLPTGLLYLPVCLSGLLIVLFCMEHILNLIINKEETLSWNS